MCNPMILTIASTGFQALQQIQQSRTEAAAMKQNAANQQAVNEYNARQNDVVAQDVAQRGSNDAAAIRENARKANAQLRTQAASTGMLADTGSFLDLQTQNAQVGAFDSLQTINNAEREAYGYKSDAASLRWQGQMGVDSANRQAKDIKRNGLLSAAGTLVTGASNYSTKFGSMNSRSQYGPPKSSYTSYVNRGRYNN